MIAIPPLRKLPFDWAIKNHCWSTRRHNIKVSGRSYYSSGKPLVFNEVDGDFQVIFLSDENGNISNYSYGTSTFRKIKGWENPTLHIKLLLASILIFTIVLLISLARVIISRYVNESKINRSSSLKYLNINSILILLFIFGIAIAAKISSLDFGVPFGVKAIFIFPVLAAILFPYCMFQLLKELKKSTITIWLKILLSLDFISIALILLIFYNYNLVGFNFV
jgi:hypothetical protein